MRLCNLALFQRTSRVSAILVALCRRARRGRNKGARRSKILAHHHLKMLSRLVLVSASSLKGCGPIGAGLVHASRSLHTSSQSLAPVPPLPEKGGKVRHGLIPEEFFQLLYPKTGVTGPYMLGTGLILYLLSKELYVINHETFAAASIGAIIIYGVKKFGPSVAAFADQLNDVGFTTEKMAMAQEVKDHSISSLTQAIEDEKKEQWRVEGRSMLFDAKRNNVSMLLETNYRERLHMVTNEVKKRLDYQIALQNLHRRMEQEHMVNWVEKNVIGSITPQQEKESIAKCITDLKALAKATQAKATA
ncbi:ATP synthase F(0) complex subunit B1, mitochondrial [Melanotaenia boesemani]|uniref:ATP synthase F(0) complex subunit B1, mitochondrial n=1 Tax=Melanotaenia boesemani TaxID=1250792 RepID=UPI001C050D62|nr:ATP synthase F(0) complex subunit B1, mitochondrial [Melanotaenia boesemani]